MYNVPWQVGYWPDAAQLERMMKKVLALFLAASVIAVVGCAKADEGDPNATTNASTSGDSTNVTGSTTGGGDTAGATGTATTAGGTTGTGTTATGGGTTG